MNFDQIQAEQEAYQSVLALLEQARTCQQLHERAGLALPERVQRLLGLSTNGTGRPAGPVRSAAHIPPPGYPTPPKGAASDWLSIDVKEAQPTTVTLAILRAEGVPVRARNVNAKVAMVLPNVTSGTLANAGTRLVADGIIERTEDGWKLLKTEKAGLIQSGRLWGPPAVFGKQELAAHRREAILHILKHYPTGLQTVQIVEQLLACSWVLAPVNKDLLKMDMQIFLEERKVRRVGNTKKWQLAPAEKGE